MSIGVIGEVIKEGKIDPKKLTLSKYESIVFDLNRLKSLQSKGKDIMLEDLFLTGRRVEPYF